MTRDARFSVIAGEGLSKCRLCGMLAAEGTVRCPGCHRSGTFPASLGRASLAFPLADGEESDDLSPVEPVPFDKVRTGKAHALVPFKSPVDALFGGGFRRGGTYLISARWGLGKSTLALQMVEGAKGAVRYVCAEEPAIDVVDRIQRMGMRRTAHLSFAETETIELALPADDVEDAAEAKAKKEAWTPEFLVNVIDSAHGMVSLESDAPRGNDHQVSAVMNHVIQYTKATRSISIVLAHENKDGGYKGSTEGPHAVTAVSEMTLEGDVFRRFTVLKCRHGATSARDDHGRVKPCSILFEMTDRGLVTLDESEE